MNFLKELTEFTKSIVNAHLPTGEDQLRVGSNIYRGALQNGQTVRSGAFVLRELVPAGLSTTGSNIVEKPISFQCCVNSYDQLQVHRDLMFKLLVNEEGAAVQLPSFLIQSVTGGDFAYAGNNDIGMVFVMNLVFRFKRPN